MSRNTPLSGHLLHGPRRIAQEFSGSVGFDEGFQRLGLGIATERSITRKTVVQEGGNIARTLGHGHNLYGPRCAAIDDEVSAHRPGQNWISGQILALMAYARRVADGVKRIEQSADPLVGGVNIILGDIVPDAIQIPIGIIAQDILRHTLAFRRCSDLRLSRARASVGETCRP